MTIVKRTISAACVLLFCQGLAFGQNAALEAQNKLLAKRAAEADAYRKLAETVYGLQLNSETYVRDFVTESDVISTSVDTFIKGIRLGKPRYYEDGVCEVDGEVTVAKLVKTLKEIHETHYSGNKITTVDIENIKTHIKKDLIQVTGMGAPRPDLPPELPEGIEDVITPLPPNYAPTTMPVPGIWKTVPPQARLMALRAARVDAQRKLLERIKGLRLTSDTLVRDFVTESDEISTQAAGIVVGAAETHRYLHSDELIAEVTMEVPVEKVLTQIKELHERHYKGRRVTTTDIMNIKKTVKRSVFEATGSGVPPARFVEQIVRTSSEIDMPDWSLTVIKVTGEGTDPNMDTAQGKLKARRAAELDGMRKLAEQIYGLRISSNTMVRDFITEYDEVMSQVDAVIRGAITSDPRYSDGVATVTVSIQGADVWRVVHSQIQIVERQ